MNAQTVADTHVEACGSCRYWKPPTGGEQVGQCRRLPPQAIVFRVEDQVQFVSRFPDTRQEDWCGDFQRS